MSENKTKGLTSKQKRAVRTNVVGYAFILPNLIGYSIFVFLPVCFSFVLSVMKWDASQAPMEFVGLQNFAQILGDDIFRKSFVNTVEYAALTVVPTLILALLLAVLLNSKIKGIAFFRTSFFFP
ncbi:MAG: sugar ABC transporter permease, partial [Hungatella sp.]